MDDRVVEFSNILRRNGIRVSLSENMDAFRALDLTGIRDSVLFRSALRTTLIKRSSDLQAFDELFDLFFFGLGESVRESDRKLMEQLGLSPRQFQALLEEIRDLLERSEGEISSLARALISGDMGQVERLVRAAAAAEGNLGNSADSLRMTAYSRMAGRLGLDALERQLEEFHAALPGSGADTETIEKISRYLEQRLRDLGRMVRDLIQQELKKSGVVDPERDRADYLLQKSFVYYTEEDIRNMNEVVVRLAQRLKNILSVRRKRARKGRFDVKDTLRANLQYGGVPFEIQFDRKRRERPQVVILCDISDSVLNASRFMLQFVYSLQELYSKVRSFIFVSDLGEVTRLFEDNEIHRAVEMALRGDIINVYTHSNFGRAFEIFYREHLSAVTKKTTFLIIGDGRNNYNRANEWAVREIQRKAKQVIWLNPESRLTWGFGDSEMPRYVPYCDVVEECRNIQQLYKVIDRIVP
ncbi:MAG: VWA domain-containing protein [Deltaproteobacteria bacterium]|nr:VWA domain-containing protein [Deltaproteobacteria bacterium]